MNINKFKLEEYLSKYEFSAKYLFCCSDVESFKLKDILSMASENELDMWNNLHLGYTEVPGLPNLRTIIAEKLYTNLNYENIFCFAGAEEGIFCTLYSLIEENDHVIILTPCYQSFIEIPRLKKAEISEIELLEENNWNIDLDAIKKSIRQNTKCIIINFPHNPTGAVINQNELDKLINICQENDIWLFSDEVYRLLGNPDDKWSEPVASIYNKGISLNVMSKSFGLAGLRVGWIACRNIDLLKKIEYMKHYTSICNSATSELLSIIALNNKDQILERNNKIVLDNKSTLIEFFKKYENIFSWIKPQGGCIGFVKYKKNEKIDIFCDNLVHKEGVLLMPGSIFDNNKNYFRIGFGRKNMQNCINKLIIFLESNRDLF